MNLNNLSYSLTSTIQKDMSNMRQKAFNYIKENPSKVATGVTVAAVLGTMPLYLPALLALGGKSKKNVHNKQKNIKTRLKNKLRKTRKSIKKNKRRKTRKSIKKNKLRKTRKYIKKNKRRKTRKYNN
jgi:ElaB/YqjD/DUF883 family membrane-anchored ribosome-binding protein